MRGQREVHEAAREEESRGEERARKCLWATLLKCRLIWIEPLTTVTFELGLKEGKRAQSCCIISIGI